MSHFTVMVLGNDQEKQLAPFDENLNVPRYIKYTREQLIEKERKEIQDYKNGFYAKYLEDKEKYRSNCSNEGHLNYLENEFPAKLNFNDEQRYQEGIKYEEPENIGENGEIYSECNPNSKWDWYQLGGRWAGQLKIKQGAEYEQPNFSWGWSEAEKQEVLQERRCDSALKKDIENIDEIICYALIKDGKWYERGQMGWFGMGRNEKDENAWDEEFKKLIADLPDDTLISIYDCHI